MTVHPQPEPADPQRVLHNARGGVYAPKGEPVVVVLETLEPAAEHVSTDTDRGDTLATASDETSANLPPKPRSARAPFLGTPDHRSSHRGGDDLRGWASRACPTVGGLVVRRRESSGGWLILGRWATR